MKRLGLLLAAVVLFVSGCAQIVVKAPEGKKIIISSQSVTSPDQMKRVLYVLYGLIPLGDNSTASLLVNYADRSEVAMTTESDLLDIVLSSVLGFATIQSRSVKVQKVK